MAKKFNYKGIASNMGGRAVTDVTLQGELFDGMTLHVVRRLDMGALIQMVSEASSVIVDMDSTIYAPELEDFCIQLFALHYYAGCPLPEKDLDKAYRVIMGTDLMEQVSPYIDSTQFANASDAIKQRVAYLREMLVSTAAQKTISLLNALEHVINDLGEASTKFNAGELLSSVTNLTNLIKNEQEPASTDSVPAVLDNIIKLPRA